MDLVIDSSPSLTLNRALMRRISSLLLSPFAILSLAISVDAAAIVWGPATTISADTDVSTLGTLDRAFRVGASGALSVTVNGVTFSPFVITGTSTTVGTTTLASNGGLGANNDLFASSSAPFSSLSASYRELLDSSANGNSSDTLTLTLSGLTIGLVYQFQWWVDDSRAAIPNRQTISTATNSVSLDHNIQDAEGGVGQFAIGTFTADATSQVITFTGTATGGGAAPQINAFQLRVIPEPSTIALLLLGGAAILHRLVRRK